MPSERGELQGLVGAILNEAGLFATRNVTITLPRATVDVDVLAEETHDGIVQRIVCEWKNWQKALRKRSFTLGEWSALGHLRNGRCVGVVFRCLHCGPLNRREDWG